MLSDLEGDEGDDDFEKLFEKQDINSKFFIAQKFQFFYQLFCSSRIGNYSNIQKGLARIEQFDKNIIVSVEEPYILFKEIIGTAIWEMTHWEVSKLFKYGKLYFQIDQF